MRAEIETLAGEITQSLARLGGIFDYDAAKRRLAELAELAGTEGFWDDPATAQGVMRELSTAE
jgi:hypothetical protein